MDLVNKVVSLLFNMLSRLVIMFLPRSKRLLVSWLQSPSAEILKPQKIKSLTVSIVSRSICHETMGLDAMILVFWMVWALSQLFHSPLSLSSVQFSSVTLSCPTLCDPMNRSTPGLTVQNQHPECTQTHVHWVSDAIQPSHPVIPFSSCLQSFSALGSFPMSQHLAWGGQSTGVSISTSVLPMKTQDWSP